MRATPWVVGVLLLPTAITVRGEEPVTIRVSGGGITVTQGDNTFNLGGRIQADAVWFAGSDTPMADGTDVRRFRIAVKGTLDRVWKYKAEYDFADARIKDLFVTRKTGGGNYTFGQFSPPISFESLQTSKWITFLERSLPVEGLLPDRELGLGYDAYAETLAFSASLTGDNVDADDPGDDSPSVLTRLAWFPRHAAGDVVHVAFAAGWVDSSTGTASFGARPEARVDGVTPKLVSVTVPEHHHWLGGFETAYARGRFSAQAEYLAAAVESATDPYFSGFYVSAACFLNDDMRTYDRGYAVFDRPAVGRDSVELAARFSRLDLSDQNLGPREDNATLGVNYYPHPSLRFSANVIHGWVEGGAAGDEEVTITALRGQLVF